MRARDAIDSLIVVAEVK